MIQHQLHLHWLPVKHNVHHWTCFNTCSTRCHACILNVIRAPTRKSPTTPSSRTIVLVACSRPRYFGLLAISVPSWTMMGNYYQWWCNNLFDIIYKFDVHPSVLPANLSLIKSNGCVASVETTPPLSPAIRCSYLTPEKKESGTLSVCVSRTSSAIVCALYLNSVR